MKVLKNLVPNYSLIKIIIIRSDVLNGRIKNHILKHIIKLSKTNGLILKVEPDSTLNVIPRVEGILKLDCRNCPIIYIPDIVSLLILDCTGCKNIRKIPYLKNIRKISFHNSTLSYFFNTTKDYKDTLKKLDQLPRKNMKENCKYLI